MKAYFTLIFLVLSLNMISQTIKDSLDKIINDHHISTGLSYSLLVAHNGNIVYQNSFGSNTLGGSDTCDKKSNYRMASVSKQFTAAAIYLLIKQKKLDLKQTLKDFFPDFSEVGGSITIDQLLSHSSGVYDYEELQNDTLTRQLSDFDILNMVKPINKTYFTPGTKFRYSNTAYCLLALIVEKASGQSFADFTNRYIFKPLKMNTTEWYGADIKNRVYGYARNKEGKIEFRDQSITSATLGDGGLYTSLSDYYRWYKNRKRVLGIDISEMIHLSSKSIFNDYSYSFGWFYEKKGSKLKTLLHSGATCGFSNIVIEIPATQSVITYFTNLADNHNSFLPIEKILISSKILPVNFSYRIMHDETH